MRKTNVLGVYAVLLTLLTGMSVVSAQEVDPKKHGAASTKAAAPGAAEKSLLIVTPEYIIGPEDVLEITVWKNADLSKQVQVRPDGRISLPLLGDISAVAKTPTQLTEEISTGLRAYMENPTISIMIKDVQSYNIYVLGEVNKPGKFPLKSKTTLLQGITVAGGFTPMAARNKIVVFRFTKDGEGQTKLKASYDDIVVRDGSSQNIELKPGDQIVVPSETMVVLPSR
ncbi:putative Polysaccharide export protein [Nitrospira japonica]|uniref:Putative Polysaccharide export protein n=1 Tax=Nitrospira japonica TaxID=1325564 RepID=A0A1W1IB10_9BACT|nr:polysaccharide biosynthesis/export family protein [Nitrospira japonica]SLM50237.1 putative Polysaccharide export protein [Nitrospira japonica]